MRRRKTSGRPLQQPDDPSEPVWRYMDLAKYIDLVARRKLRLTRVDQFADPFEATPPAAYRRERDRVIPKLRRARRHTYANCWRLGHDESEAMWKLYCGSTGGIAIALPYADLAASARAAGCEIGLVRYIDYASESFPDADDVVNASMYKRLAFAHEREVRLVLHVPAGRRKEEPPAGIEIDWDPQRWVRRVVPSPLSEEYFCSAVEMVTRAFAPRLARRFCASQMQIEPLL